MTAEEAHIKVKESIDKNNELLKQAIITYEFAKKHMRFYEKEKKRLDKLLDELKDLYPLSPKN